MDRLSFDFIKNKVKSTGYNVSEHDVFDVYRDLMKSDKYKIYSKDEQSVLITNIAQQLSNEGVTKGAVYRFYSDIKHFDFYNNYIGFEETDKMENAIKKNNLSIDILKGVRVKEYGYEKLLFNGGYVEYEFETINGSPVLTFLNIVKNNKSIYNYGGRGEVPEQFEELGDDVIRIKGIDNKYYDNIAKKGKSIPLREIEYDGDVYIEARSIKNNKLYYYNKATGGRVSKEYMESII